MSRKQQSKVVEQCVESINEFKEFFKNQEDLILHSKLSLKKILDQYNQKENKIQEEEETKINEDKKEIQLQKQKNDSENNQIKHDLHVQREKKVLKIKDKEHLEEICSYIDSIDIFDTSNYHQQLENRNKTKNSLIYGDFEFKENQENNNNLTEIENKWSNCKLEYSYQKEQDETKKTQKILEIKFNAIKTLFPKTYLNDEIIALWNQFIFDHLPTPEVRQQTSIQNTYIIQKLSNGFNTEFPLKNIDFIINQNFPQVERWNKIDLFSKRYIIFPFHQEEHWSLFIVCNPQNIFNNSQSNDSQQSCILYFDSMCLLEQVYPTIIRKFLQRLAQKSINSLIQGQINQEINEKNLPCYQILVPRQYNLYDCGIYMLEYIEQFLKDPEEMLKDINKFQAWNKLKLFPKCLTKVKRQLMLKTIEQLIQGEQKQDVFEFYRLQKQRIIESGQIQSHLEYDYDIYEKYINEHGDFNYKFKNQPKELQNQILDYYMNPILNNYELQ